MLDLFKAIGLGLVVLLPLANPLTTVALFLGLAGNMNSAERNRQSLMASVYVFAIMMVAYYGRATGDGYIWHFDSRSANCRRLNRRVYRFSDALSATESD
ncbi:multiple antibiotic resistance protein [Escherichia coli]|nr:multiple antibiotic resistance protein [Escherichia coli]